MPSTAPRQAGEASSRQSGHPSLRRHRHRNSPATCSRRARSAPDTAWSGSLANRYIANFDRAPIFGVSIGHFSPIGGYDPERDLVALLDVTSGTDRPWSHPSSSYAAVQTKDPTMGRFRGLLRIAGQRRGTRERRGNVPDQGRLRHLGDRGRGARGPPRRPRSRPLRSRACGSRADRITGRSLGPGPHAGQTAADSRRQPRNAAPRLRRIGQFLQGCPVAAPATRLGAVAPRLRVSPDGEVLHHRLGFRSTIQSDRDLRRALSASAVPVRRQCGQRGSRFGRATPAR